MPHCRVTGLKEPDEGFHSSLLCTKYVAENLSTVVATRNVECGMHLVLAGSVQQQASRHVMQCARWDFRACGVTWTSQQISACHSNGTADGPACRLDWEFGKGMQSPAWQPKAELLINLVQARRHKRRPTPPPTPSLVNPSHLHQHSLLYRRQDNAGRLCAIAHCCTAPTTPWAPLAPTTPAPEHQVTTWNNGGKTNRGKTEAGLPPGRAVQSEPFAQALVSCQRCRSGHPAAQ
jgi:hypothetical protein